MNRFNGWLALAGETVEPVGSNLSGAAVTAMNRGVKGFRYRI